MELEEDYYCMSKINGKPRASMDLTSYYDAQSRSKQGSCWLGYAIEAHQVEV